MTLIGAQVRAEDRTNNGRIDAVIETPSHIFIYEFKLHASAESALEQIKEKEYFQKFLLKNKIILLVGVQFDMDTRNIKSWTSSTLDAHT